MLKAILQILIFLVVLVIVAVVVARMATKNIGNSSSAGKHVASGDVGHGYERKPFLSERELHFLGILKELEPQGFVIVPQVSLASVIDGESVLGRHGELNHNISFGVFDKNYKLLLLIAVSALPYENSDSQKQTDKLKAICVQVGVRLVSFYTGAPSTKDYVIQQILDGMKPLAQSV
jgi:hypothetical protein